MWTFEMYWNLLFALLHMKIFCNALENHTIVDYCVTNCTKENELGYQGIKYFNDCMKQCTVEQGKPWPLNLTSSCEKDQSDFGHKRVCSASDVRASFYEVSVFSQIWQYLIVYWQPCAVAPEHLEGYQIELHDRSLSGSYSDCVQFSLSRNLVINDKESEYAVFFADRHLKYDTIYKVFVYGLPMNPDNVLAHLHIHSKSCSNLNGHGSCSCGLSEYKPLPPPNITVTGYLVRISVQPLKPCFSVIRYDLSIRLKNGSDVSNRKFDERRQLNKDMTETFYPLYPKNDMNLQFVAKYRVISTTGPAHSEDMPIKIALWNPCKPNVSTEGLNVSITWCCAPAVYNISHYELKLVHNNSQSKVFVVNSRCQNRCNMSTTIMSLSPGVYSSQIREWRDPKYNSHAMWSPLSNTFALALSSDENLNNHVFVVAIAITAFTTCAALVVAMLCCKNFCKKVRRLPDSVRNAVGGKSLDRVHVCKTVWLVWQADSQNNSVAGEVHSENVRHLASFLANHCGLYVILDQYEVTTAPSLASWLKDKQKAADTVIFICPHQCVAELDYSLNQLVGNFVSVYNLYESALLFENFSVKFASVMLPYSRATFYAEAKMLLHKIPSFKLMDDIDNLYFFIQNRPKAGPYGRYVLEHVNGRDYSKTEEGAKLKAGFQEMVKIMNGDGQPVVASTVQESMPISDNLQERELDICNIADQEILLRHSDALEPHPPPPIQPQEDADHTVFVINTCDLLSQQPIESECIEAVTFDSNCPLLSPSPIGTMSL